MAKRNFRGLFKRSNISGKKPTSSDLLLGEVALNTADAIMYTSGTTHNDIVPIGWDRVSKTGDTMTGQLIVPSVSAATYYGDGSNLTGINVTSALSALTDTNITLPQDGSVLLYNGVSNQWENNNPDSHMKFITISTWTYLSPNTYYYDFVHGLSTFDLLWSIRDIVTNSYVLPSDIIALNSNTLRIVIGDNTSTLRVSVSDAIYGLTNTPTRLVVNTSVDYIASPNEIIWANSDSLNTDLIITLPDVSVSTNLPVSINNIGNVGGVLVDGNGANINGVTTFLLLPQESIEFYNNGVEWRQHN